MWSLTTMNIMLAVFSMLMAVVALGLLAFIIAREHYMPKETAKLQFRERIKRHESVVVDFRDPSTVPDHFLQLNTLMFEKRKHRASNNQIKEVEKNILNLAGMEKMMTPISEEDEMSQRSRSSVDGTTKKAESTSSSEGFYSNSARSSSISSSSPSTSTSDSEAEYADVPLKDEIIPKSNSPIILTNSITRAKRSFPYEESMIPKQLSDNSINLSPTSNTKEIILECGNEYSLC
ncbi:unnamed protein product, partial [Mesorhabditis belari]|uniref:Uncharacterized protein n=1 Tax=Mesorhabditis belari TaxID=2138241 RepID=A0AAF3J7P0_9BILA